jgi:hypothetical protein
MAGTAFAGRGDFFARKLCDSLDAASVRVLLCVHAVTFGDTPHAQRSRVVSAEEQPVRRKGER